MTAYLVRCKLPFKAIHVEPATHVKSDMPKVSQVEIEGDVLEIDDPSRPRSILQRIDEDREQSWDGGICDEGEGLWGEEGLSSVLRRKLRERAFKPFQSTSTVTCAMFQI